MKRIVALILCLSVLFTTIAFATTEVEGDVTGGELVICETCDSFPCTCHTDGAGEEVPTEGEDEPTVCETCGEAECICVPTDGEGEEEPTACETCGEAPCTCEPVEGEPGEEPVEGETGEETTACEECGKNPCECEPTEGEEEKVCSCDPAPAEGEAHGEGCDFYVAPEDGEEEDSEDESLFEQLMACPTIEDMYAMLMGANANIPGAVALLTADEIDALFERIDTLDPYGVSPATEALIDLLITLPNFMSGAEQDGDEGEEWASGNSIDAAGIYYADSTTLGYFGASNNSAVIYDSSADALVFTASGGDPYHYFTVPSDSTVGQNGYGTYRYIAVTVKSSHKDRMQLFLTTRDQNGVVSGAVTGVSKGMEYTGKNEYQTLIFDLTTPLDDQTKSIPTGNIAGFRLDYQGADSGEVYIDSIAFCKTLSDAEYIEWERELVRNTPGKFVTSEEMLNMVSMTHNCTVEYVDLQEGDQTIGVFKITMNKTNCACVNGHDPKWHAPGSPDSFDPQFQLTIPGSISSDYDYLVLNFMAPSLDVIGVCAEGSNHMNEPVETIPIRIGTFYAVNGGYTAKFERNTTIDAPGVFYSEIVNINDDLQNDAATIRFDPFNTHFAKAGSVLYLQAVMFCKTEEEAKNVGEEQLGQVYPYGYTLNFEANATGVSNMPTGEMIMRSAYEEHSFTVSYDVPTRPNYKFHGWSLERDGSGEVYQPGEVLAIEGIYGETVTKTLYAIWQEGTNQIRYTSNIAGAKLTTGEELAYALTYSNAQSFMLPEAQADGYDFRNWRVLTGNNECWSKTEYDAGTEMPVGTQGDVIMVAQFTPKEYTLTFDTAGGDLVENLTFDIEDEIQLPEPDYPGYNLVGWQVTAIDAAEGNWETAATYSTGVIQTGKFGNATLTALWEEKNATITYVVDGGNGSIDVTSETFKAVTGAPKGSTATANTGYRLDGWFTANDEKVSGELKFVPAKTGNVWTDATYYIKFVQAYGDLTVAAVCGDTDQTFIYVISGTSTLGEDISLTVVVPAGETITVVDMPVGRYSIAEQGDWNWRYTNQEETAKSLTVNGIQWEFTYPDDQNPADPVNNKWLNDYFHYGYPGKKEGGGAGA